MPKQKINIAAALVIVPHIRIWHGYEDRDGIENCFTDVRLPQSLKSLDHEKIVAFLKKWRGIRPMKIVAYQCLNISIITDNRAQFGHKNHRSKTVADTLTKRIVVYTDKFGCPEMTIAELAIDAEWVKQSAQMTVAFSSKLYDPKVKAQADALEAEARHRRITIYTQMAYEELRRKYSSDQKIIKLGPMTYFALTDDTEYRPVQGLNPDPRR